MVLVALVVVIAGVVVSGDGGGAVCHCHSCHSLA